jgi:hypothetical protein
MSLRPSPASVAGGGSRVPAAWAPLVVVLPLLTGACAARSPRPVPLDPDEAVRHLSWVRNDAQALASVALVMTRDLRLPPVQATLHLFAGAAAFEAALVARGAPAPLARVTAQTMTAVGRPGEILANEHRLNRLRWDARTFVLAHEMGHVLQYDLAGGVRGSADQWIREGFAEWVAMAVVSRLGGAPFGRLAAGRARAIGRARVPLPPLTTLVTFADWTQAAEAPGSPPVYELATLAVLDLIETHGLAAVLEYFRASARSGGDANFERAFGTTRAAFDAQLARRYALRR